MDSYREFILTRIKKKLKLILSDSIFNMILASFWKTKSFVRLVVPQPVIRIIRLIRRRAVCEYISFKCRNYSIDKLAHFYTSDYQGKYDMPDEVRIKKWQAVAIKKAIPELKKVLVAGCSNGGLVKSFRDIKIDAYGFDISPNLDEVTAKGINPYVKQGDILKIPFTERFDAFVAIDVFEHIPMRKIDEMVEEISRINAEYMITVICYDNYRYAEHTTLKPLPWWEKKFKNHYKVDKNIRFSNDDIPLLYSLNNDSKYRLLFWRRI